jgi:hypothetical protein
MNWWFMVLMGFAAGGWSLHAASTTLIGGSTGNGDFEADTSSTNKRTFSDTPNWTNLSSTGLGQSEVATRNDKNLSGSLRNAVMNIDGTRIFGNDPGYTIQSGDVFSLSYQWRDAFLWDDTADQVRVDLFTTSNDTLTGTQTILYTLYSGLSTSNETWETVTANRFYTAGGGAVGKKLFIQFQGWAGNSSDTEGYARLDNFTLTVVPEPDPVWLLAALSGAGVLVRRRRRRVPVSAR